jgi:hypothetical protein
MLLVTFTTALFLIVAINGRSINEQRPLQDDDIIDTLKEINAEVRIIT